MMDHVEMISATIKMVCAGCSESHWRASSPSGYACAHCGDRKVQFIRLKEGVNKVGFKKHGVGEVINVEETEIVKTATTEWTEEDDKALIQENNDEE